MPDLWMDVDTALSEVPVNVMPLLDDTDFKTIEDAVAYNAAGMALFWHFITTAGAYTVTAVTPTTGGDYDWTDQGTAGIYTIEIPASGGASINNNTEGVGWFTGKATGVLPWRGPTIGFRAAALNDALIDGGDLLDVSVTQFGGTAGTFSGGRPEVNASHIAGSAVSTSSAQIGVNVVNAGGTAWGSGAITAGAIAADAIGASELAADAVAEIADAVWDEARSGHTTDGTFGQINQAVRSGTAQGGGSTTITLDASASATDDLYNGCLVWVVAGVGAGQAGVITDYVGSTKVATVDNTWRTNPDNTSVFVLLPGSLGLTSATLAASVWDASTSTYNSAGTFGAGVRLSSAAVQSIWDALTSALTTVGSIGKRIVDYLTGDAYARIGAPVGASISADIAAVQADTDNIQTRIPAALVSGRMDSSVGAYQSGLTPLQPTVSGRTLDVSSGGEAGVDWANVGSPTTTVGLSGTTVGTVSAVTAISTGGITAGSIAADAIGASELASDAVTEIQSGLATAANLATLTSYVDTEVAAIKAKTDNLPASPAATGDAMTLTSGERNSVADALLNRGLDGAGASSRKVREALAFMRNKWTISGSTLTIYDVDDTTVLWTGSTTTASGNPVTGVDPAT